jgi:hypothetical protein
LTLNRTFFLGMKTSKIVSAQEIGKL